jgi:membrane-anchored protein YejM (alkaline phosphatase superfamily)
MPWWHNTLVIITADHGHRYPRNKELIQKERFHIPLLMTGGAVARDTLVHTIGSQTDIANTLLAQLSTPVPDFVFSRNLLDKGASSFAAYFFTDGYGFIFPETHVVYDNAGKRFLKSDATERQLDVSKAYQQKLFINYNHLDK